MAALTRLRDIAVLVCGGYYNRALTWRHFRRINAFGIICRKRGEEKLFWVPELFSVYINTKQEYHNDIMNSMLCNLLRNAYKIASIH